MSREPKYYSRWRAGDPVMVATSYRLFENGGGEWYHFVPGEIDHVSPRLLAGGVKITYVVWLTKERRKIYRVELEQLRDYDFVEPVAEQERVSDSYSYQKQRAMHYHMKRRG